LNLTLFRRRRAVPQGRLTGTVRVGSHVHVEEAWIVETLHYRHLLQTCRRRADIAGRLAVVGAETGVDVDLSSRKKNLDADWVCTIARRQDSELPGQDSSSRRRSLHAQACADVRILSHSATKSR